MEMTAELSCEELRIFPGRHQVYCSDQPVELTRKESELLLHLMENRGIVMTRDQESCAISGAMILTVSTQNCGCACANPPPEAGGYRQTGRNGQGRSGLPNGR